MEVGAASKLKSGAAAACALETILTGMLGSKWFCVCFIDTLGFNRIHSYLEVNPIEYNGNYF